MELLHSVNTLIYCKSGNFNGRNILMLSQNEHDSEKHTCQPVRLRILEIPFF